MRLIDADRLKRQVEGRSWRAKGKMVELIDNSPTVDMRSKERKQLEDAGLLYREVSPIFAVDVGAFKAALEEEARRPRGRWEIHEDASWAGGGFTKCSACGYSYSWGAFFSVDEWPFCPHCGIRMEAQP